MENSFDRIENLVPVPGSSRKEKTVCLGVKVLQTKKETRKILPEEKYIENLEKIIVRDYFPELPKLQAQSEYLEAVARNDQFKIRELHIRYNTSRCTDMKTTPYGNSTLTPYTPSVFDPDTPGPSVEQSPYANKDGDNEALLKKKKSEKIIDKLSVQTYLDKYTSEDNASFEELAQIHNKRERVRNVWMYEAERKHNESLVYRNAPEAIFDAADQQLVARRNGEIERPLNIDNWTYKARNNVLFNVDEAPLTMAEYMERAKQNEKIINKEATRFPSEVSKQPIQAVMARVAIQQAVSNAGRFDITGKEKGVITNNKLGLVSTPSPAPWLQDSPLMSWGEIEGTPFRLDAPDISAAVQDAPLFKIPEVPLREKIAQEMSEQIGKRYGGKRKHAMSQIQKIAPKTPGFSSSRTSIKLASMSPAARRLATDKLGIRIDTGKIKLHSPRTPGSAHSRNLPTTSSPATIQKMVRVKREIDSALLLESNLSSSTLKLGDSALTADLLSFPASPSNSCYENGSKRPSAADFF